jgi:hypothetical protein
VSALLSVGGGVVQAAGLRGLGLGDRAGRATVEGGVVEWWRNVGAFAGMRGLGRVER